MTEPLLARHSLEYPGGYTRSVGPIVGRYLTGLRDGRIEGVRLRGSLLGRGVEVLGKESPGVHRLVLGDQSRVEVD